MKDETMKDWIEKYLQSIKVCERALKKAEQFDDPQTAWNNWDNSNDMLWLLSRMKYNRETLLRCICNMAEHVLHLFENKFPDDIRPRQAIEAARKVADENTQENRDAAREATYAADKAACNVFQNKAAYAAAHTAAYVSAYATTYTNENRVSYFTKVASDAVEAICTAFYAIEAIGDATYEKLSEAERRTGKPCDNIDCIAARLDEQKWQADCIRKHFPNFVAENL